MISTSSALTVVASVSFMWSATHRRSGGYPSVGEYWSASRPRSSSTRAVTSLSSATGNDSGAGSPPAKEITSGRCVSLRISLISEALTSFIRCENRTAMEPSVPREARSDLENPFRQTMGDVAAPSGLPACGRRTATRNASIRRATPSRIWPGGAKVKFSRRWLAPGSPATQASPGRYDTRSSAAFASSCDWRMPSGKRHQK